MANRRGKSESSDRFYFLVIQNTVDSDCSHKIERCLLLGRKAMTNLDSALESKEELKSLLMKAKEESKKTG